MEAMEALQAEDRRQDQLRQEHGMWHSFILILQVLIIRFSVQDRLRQQRGINHPCLYFF